MALSNKWKFLKSLSSAKVSSRKPGSETVNVNTIVIAVNGDTIGPPDPVSNLRPVVFHVPKNESHIEKKFRTHRESVQKWNEEFWTIHNEKFQKERNNFLKRLSMNENNSTVSADDMSIFYKDFLDRHWAIHLKYNREWYKRNFELIILALKVEMDNFKKRTTSKYFQV